MSSSSELAAKADRALASGRLDQAEALSREALSLEPPDRTAYLVLGIVLVKLGRYEESLAPLGQAAANGAPGVHVWLSRALRRLGRPEAAVLEAQGAVEEQPQNSAALFQLGLCYLDSKQFQQAVPAFTKAAALDPNSHATFHGLGAALLGSVSNTGAVHAYRQALKLSPGYVPSLEGLYQALIDESDPVGALKCAEDLLSLQPSNSTAHLRLAQALVMAGRMEKADAQLKWVMEEGGEDGSVAFAVGKILQSMGRIKESEAQFRRSIELAPEQGTAYAALAYNRRMDESDQPLLDRMRGLSHLDRLPSESRSYLHYGLGKSLEDLRQYEESMNSYDLANQLRYELSGGCRFDRQGYEDRIATVMKRQVPERVRGSNSDLPIFVIGMLRSGTTLVDQILSSHPDVGSVGEQGFWLHHREAPEAELESLADSYLARLLSLSPGHRRVVDKMPDNYLELPRIHAALPQAKMIHLVRDPIDTCVSIFTTINRLRVDWAHHKGNIAFVYGQYQKLMGRWRELLPPGTLLEVRYEELVIDQERVTREMLEFCGLEWNDACLYPERSQRTVATPSVWQVRQPVYVSSVGRWRNFEPWLGEFRELVSAC